MSVNRDIVHIAADVFRRHGCEELLSVNGKHFRLDTQDIQMPCGIGLRNFLLYGNFRNFRKCFVVFFHDFFSSLLEQGKLVQLTDNQRRLDIRHTVIHA